MSTTEPTIIESGGRTWKLEPLTIHEEEILEKELRQILAVELDVVSQVNGMRGGLHREETIELLKWALAEQLRLSRLGCMELAQEFRRPKVQRAVLRHQLRKNHPEVTDADVDGLLADFGVRETMRSFGRILDAVLPTGLIASLSSLRRDGGGSRD